MRRVFLGCFLLFSLIIAPSFIQGAGHPAKRPDRAPTNPAYLEQMAKEKRGEIVRYTEDGHYLGAIPPVFDMNRIRGGADDAGEACFLSSYDLRNSSRVTSVKDQGSCGSCWAFATYGSLESCLLPGETNDFSEQDLNKKHGFYYKPCKGGNAWMSAAYLLRWAGPVSESDYPYPYSPMDEAMFTVRKHVQQVIFLPTRKNYTDNAAIKSCIQKYGAVYISFYWDSSGYNSGTTSFYQNWTTSTNHAVTAVGWDDSYAKSKFGSTPAGNGAFIVKNSWGDSWGDGGYFYLSYYDKSVNYFTCFNNAEATTNYSRIYQYDPLGWVDSYGISSRTIWAANIFTALDSQPINAVGLYACDKSVRYTIYVYTGVSANNPISGTLAVTQSGSQKYPGFYTVNLNTPVTVSNGVKFSVVIKFTNKTHNYPAAYEYADSGYSNKARAAANQSFYSGSGTSWFDLTSWTSSANNCIKAYAGGSN